MAGMRKEKRMWWRVADRQGYGRMCGRSVLRKLLFPNPSGYVCNELNIRVAEAGRSDWNLIFRRRLGTMQR
jgi:hypothetical protein